MAPEQIERPLTVDHRADIYSLGVVFYEMLTGDLPLGKFPPPSRKVQVDVRLDDIVLRALENNPARRYQHASEVKSEVQIIADTPGVATTSTMAPPKDEFIRWAGFRLVRIRNGARTVNWSQVGVACAVLFGVLTLAFGLVTLGTQRSVMGWLGVVGWPSVVVRIALAASFVAFGTWRALRSKATQQSLPQTPLGTVILPPERVSRKAVIGACWASLFFIAGSLLWVTTGVAHVSAEMTDVPTVGMRWWQILLSVTLLPLGAVAPFGTTLLGWLGIGDIRRGQGRISGLPLAVFDGLFFPLLALDVFLCFGIVNAFDWFAGKVTEPAFRNLPREIVVVGATAICVLVDFLIVRRVWRAVRLDGVPVRVASDWWWSTKPGAVTIGILCMVVIGLVANRREQPGIFKTSPQQIARKDSKTGALVARLPNGGIMELLAIADAGAARSEWWRPDGRSLAPTAFEFETSNSWTVPNTVPKNLIFRFEKLPDGTGLPILESNPGSGHLVGDTVRRDGLVLEDAWPIRMAWQERVDKVTLRLGVSLVPWFTMATSDAINRSSSGTRRHGDPNIQVNFHQAGERDGQTLLTVVRSVDDGKWQTRIVAVDTNQVEHEYSSAAGTPTGKSETWTYTFRIPLAAVKEFRAQIRPLHWVEFRNVALHEKDLSKRVLTQADLPKHSEAQVAVTDTKSGGLIAELPGRGTVELLALCDSGAAPNEWWLPDGTAIPDTIYEVLQVGACNFTGWTNKGLVMRLRDLPSGADGPMLKFQPSGGSSAGGELIRNGKRLTGGWPVRAAFQPRAVKTTMRAGFGLGKWSSLFALMQYA